MWWQTWSTPHPGRRLLNCAWISSLPTRYSRAQGALHIDQVRTKRGLLQELIVPWEVDGSLGRMTFTLTGKMENQVPIQGKGEVTEWQRNGQIDFSDAHYDVELQAPAVSGAVGARLLEQPLLEILLGDSIAVKAAAQGSLKGKSVVRLGLQGEGIQGKLALRLEGDHLLLNDSKEPALLSLTITPQKFAALRDTLQKEGEKDKKFLLQNPAQITLQLEQLKLPLEETAGWTQVALHARVDLDKLSILDTSTDQFIGFEEVHGRFSSDQLKKAIAFDLRATQKDRTGQVSGLHLTGDVQNGWLPTEP